MNNPFDGWSYSSQKTDNSRILDIYGQGPKEYYGNSSFETVDDPDNWLECPNCGLKPIKWVFNNGNVTACGCGKSAYDYFKVEAESAAKILSLHHGNLNYYDRDKLRKNWNIYCQTGKVPILNYDVISTKTVFLVLSIDIYGDLNDESNLDDRIYFKEYQTGVEASKLNLEDAFNKSISMPCNDMEIDLDDDGNAKIFDVIEMIELKYNHKQSFKFLNIYENADLKMLDSLRKMERDNEQLKQILMEMI